jgi:transposase
MEADKKRKTYDRDFKVNAVALVTEGSRKVREVARELGIDANTLYHWKRELQEEREGAFPGKGHLSQLEEENRRLRRELAEVKEDREILKKALAYFSRRGK